MENRRKVSDLIPYKVRENKVFAYMQRRTKDAKKCPSMFGFFGGGAKVGENPEEALKREIKEELSFVLESFIYFKKYEFENYTKDVFLLQVEDDFDKKVTVLEGEYGKWFSEQEALSSQEFIEDDRIVLRDFYEFLRADGKL